MKNGLLVGILVASLALGGVAAADDSFPVFPPDAVGAAGPIQPILDAAQGGNYLGAIDQTETLIGTLSPLDPLVESAVFLLGDLYFKSGESGGGPDALSSALSAYQNGIIRFPDSDNGIRALIRMGDAYRTMKFYPESIASFRRVISKHPKSRFVLKARLGMADTYRVWGKIQEAKDIYKKLGAIRQSPQDHIAIHRGEADIAYQDGDLGLAYKRYKSMGLRPKEYGAEDRKTLFQFGDAAYRTGQYKQARSVLLAYYDVFQQDPLAPIALAMAGETWRLDKKDKGADGAYEAIRNTTLLMGTETLGQKAGAIISEIGALGRKRECAPRLPQIRPSDCVPAKKEAADGDLPRGIREIVNLSRGLMQETALAPMYQWILFNAAKALRGQGLLDVPLEIENHLRPALGMQETSFQKMVRATFQQTMQTAVAELSDRKEDHKIAELYFRYPAALSAGMRTGATGMRIAESMNRIGLLSDAAEIYRPIASQTRHASAVDALARLGNIHRTQGETVKAHEAMSQFLLRYPTADPGGKVMQDFGALLADEGEVDLAIEKYNDWLLRYPQHPDGAAVLSALAATYVKKGALEEAAATYLRLLGRAEAKTAAQYLAAADVHYQLERYREALAHYESALKADPEFLHAPWARLQSANSYRALGQVTKGHEIYAELAEKSTDPVIKSLAAEKAHILSGSAP